ncbi:MAG: membrane protein insertion efficiency factor YidD [Gammaproteobacteria bacterium]|nr:membrane protein insertion efficiency factor YidD [Gammaproteobacteria bacterium]MCH9744493.1 membrane protein insertion efficiency factor YidD [Gammaproteobacteria bacterium]
MPGKVIQTIIRGQKKALIGLIGVYRTCVSPFFANRCRFYPSCSEYAQQAIQKHGCVKGGCLATWRILKCHPFHSGGHDPVPTSKMEQ